MNENEEQPVEDELDVTVAEAVRPKQRGELEDLIATELAIAVLSTDRIQKIRHVYEAYRALPPQTRENLFNEEERDEFKRLARVCSAFLNLVELPPPTPYNTGRFACVPWGFPIREAPVYLYWVRRVWLSSEEDRERWQQFRERMNAQDEKQRKKAWDEYYVMLAEFLRSGFAPLAVVKEVETEYVDYALPKFIRLMRVIYQNIISPETWSETLMLLRGGRRQTL
ncbi:MAG: hypothetical protein ACQXXG_09515 [Candidatus Bathyarchaeia archaeon]|nr:hypothetical protein [Candidatus Bathyarchaeota archaeon]